MPDGVFPVISLLSLGFVLLLLEIVVPGGVLGGLGVLAIAYGCFLAFGLSTSWGLATLGLSVAVTGVALRLFMRSRMGKSLVLGDIGTGSWKANEAALGELLGHEARTLTQLRPAGIADFDGRRVDVVADSELIAAGTLVRVCRVEGNRVVVEPVEESAASEVAAPASGEGGRSALP